MSSAKSSSEQGNCIRPYRNIPFDIGASLNEKDICSIKCSFAEKGLTEEQIPQMMQSFSMYIRFVFKVNENIRLYIYSYGIGVFTLRDDDYSISSEKYAVDYCGSRKATHHSILKGNHKYSALLYSVMNWLRKSVALNHKKTRMTSNETWEHNGPSYVMTVSAVQINDTLRFGFQDLSNIEQRNLLIMLEPGIVHQEDSLLMDSLNNEIVFDPYSLEDFNEQKPVNWMRSSDMGLYISWAAVVIYTKELDDNSAKYIEYMEADLQAMWMYVYCMYYVTTHRKKKETKASDLKKELFSFKRMYNEFMESDDTSVAEYFRNIRNELIRTSEIEEEKEKYLEYLNFCIDDTISLNEEKSRKYSVFSEILLFIIAYAQIAPLLYELLMGDYVIVGVWQIIVIIAIAVIGTILIIRKG